MNWLRSRGKGYALLIGAAVLTVGVLGLSGCGEREQVVLYKQGKYQGKPDTRPWDSPEFGGARTKWEEAIKARNHNQNEYRRIPG